jgi:hypothetical protein
LIHYYFLNLRLVIGSDPDKLFSIKSAIDKAIPCLFIQGTGVLGDFSSCLLEFFKRKQKCSEESCNDITKKTKEEKDIILSIRKCVKDKWGFKDEDTVEKYTNCILNIIKSKNLDLLIYKTKWEKNFNEIKYEYSFKENTKSLSFEYEILKTIIEYKRNKGTNLIRLIQMTLKWNRSDIAKREILDKNIDWVNLIEIS